MHAVVLLRESHPNNSDRISGARCHGGSWMLVLRIPEQVGIVLELRIRGYFANLPVSHWQGIVLASYTRRIECENFAAAIERCHAVSGSVNHHRSRLGRRRGEHVGHLNLLAGLVELFSWVELYKQAGTAVKLFR